MKGVVLRKYFTAANALTSVRILGALCLIFIKPFTLAFNTVYIICGISDAFDGFVARLTKSASEFGAKLDSVADLVLYAVMVLKIFPALIGTLPVWIWYAVTAVVIMRIISYMTVAIKHNQFASLHTKLNKISGFAVFMIAYMIKLPVAVPYCITACGVCAVSSFEEMMIHVKNNEYKGK